MFTRAMGPAPDWPMVFKEWEKSGQNQRLFCEERGYSYSRFKNARSEHGYTNGRSKAVIKKRRKSTEPASSKALPLEPAQGNFFSLSSESRTTLLKVPQRGNLAAEVGELEVLLPLGVVLKFRGLQE